MSPASVRKAQMKALRQVEFYLSDSNLQFDDQLWEVYMRDPDHWIPLRLIADFPRMLEYPCVWGTGCDWLVKALGRSNGFLEVDAAGENVRRTGAFKSLHFDRTVYASDFGRVIPQDFEFAMESFFAQYGETNAVKMEYDDSKAFTGTVFCEYKLQESVDAILQVDSAPSWNGLKLSVITKATWCENKIKELGLDGVSARIFLETRKREGSRPLPEKAPTPRPTGRVFWMRCGDELDIMVSAEGTINPDDVKWPKGCTLGFTGVGKGPLDWVAIRAPLKNYFHQLPLVQMADAVGGVLIFHRTLTNDDIEEVKERLPAINGGMLTYTRFSAEEEATFQITRVSKLADEAFLGLYTRGTGRNGRRFDEARAGRGPGYKVLWAKTEEEQKRSAQ
ncbi:hypothetical protein BOTBODRAFT_174734 [Botryobasidium botryosum FD-172 SS1]|uniref:HTH La-type RNA-binding domain-containing protein n=1 Tax=Botryobasidium botryosum (strain FD-172 SS1) TaxID=930990 RepID=A0A067MSJ9_BOTB1|nr:hypothetical protein BOTBODRAFT_174734 [Botryobasidium botryosum FD-172 SS1]